MVPNPAGPFCKGRHCPLQRAGEQATSLKSAVLREAHIAVQAHKAVLYPSQVAIEANIIEPYTSLCRLTLQCLLLQVANETEAKIAEPTGRLLTHADLSLALQGRRAEVQCLELCDMS